METLLAMRRMPFPDISEMTCGILLWILLVSVDRIFDIPNLPITPGWCAFRSSTIWQPLLSNSTVSLLGMRFPGLSCYLELILFNCYYSHYPEHYYGSNTEKQVVEQEEENCLTDLLPSSFVAIPSYSCDSSIPPYLIPSFPNLLSMQKAAYNFDCTNSEALGITQILAWHWTRFFD